MSPLSALFLFVQALLIQTAFSQVISSGLNSVGVGLNNVGLGGVSNAGYGVPDVTAFAQLPVSGPYGGVGTGEISVAGEVSAAGQTLVTGQVPVIGSVSFSGQIPASGIVSIAGNCGCGNVPL